MHLRRIFLSGNYPEVAIGYHQPCGSYTPDEIDHRDILSFMLTHIRCNVIRDNRDTGMYLDDEKRAQDRREKWQLLNHEFWETRSSLDGRNAMDDVTRISYSVVILIDPTSGGSRPYWRTLSEFAAATRTHLPIGNRTLTHLRECGVLSPESLRSWPPRASPPRRFFAITRLRSGR